jgi:hypothetical protein
MQRRSCAVGAGVVLVLVSGTSLSAQSKEPLLGTWEQNIEKSKCVIHVTGESCEPPPQRPTTRVFVDLGGGFVYATNDGVDAAGAPTGNRVIFRRDGKDYPVAARDQPGIVTIAFTTKSLNPFVGEYLVKLDGQVLSRASETLSPDGNTYSVAQSGTNIRGQDFTNLTVFERVRTARK